MPAQTPALRRLVVMADTHVPSKNKRQVAALHGHLGFRLNRTAGMTALAAAKRGSART
jgi:hypothetical protein